MKLPVSIKMIEFIKKEDEYIESDGASLEVKFRVPSMALQDEMTAVREKHLDELNKLDDEYTDLKKFVDKDNNLKASAMTPDDNKRSFEKLGKITKADGHYKIEYIKYIINTKLLPTKHQELINLDWDHLFWRSQNIDEIGEVVASFRDVLQV